MSTCEGNGLRRWYTHLWLRARIQMMWLVALPLAVLILTALLCPSYGTTYPTRVDQLQAVAQARANSTMMLTYGDLAPDANAAQLAIWELGAMTTLILGTVIVLRTASLTRGEEDEGRAEILHSVGVGPVARTVAHACVVALLAALLGAAAGAGLLALNSTTTGDARAYGAAVGLTCALLAALIQMGAQLVSDAAGARSLGLGILAAVYFAYGLDCARDWQWAHWVGMCSPFRLREEFASGTRSWVTWAWALGAWILLTGVTAALARRRDLGLGLVTLQPPWRRITLRSRGPVALALRLSAASLVSWALTVSIVSWILIDMSKTLVERFQQGGVAADSGLGSILSGGDSPGESFLAYIGALAGALAASQAVALASRAGYDEVTGRLEIVAQTGVTPTQARQAWWVAAVTGSGLTLLSSAGFAAAAGHDALGTSMWDAMRLVAGQWPAAVAAATVTSALCAARPRWRSLAWCPVLVSLGMTQFGATLELPERVRDANPLAQAGHVGSWWLLGTSTALICVSTVLLRRRDLALAGPVRKVRRRLTHRTASTYSRG